jgi:hypothetical protein
LNEDKDAMVKLSDSPATDFRLVLRERRGELLRELLALTTFEEWYEGEKPGLAPLVEEYQAADKAVLDAMGRWFVEPVPDNKQIADRLLRAIDELALYLRLAEDETDPDGCIAEVLDSHANSIISPMSRRFAEVLWDAVPPLAYPPKRD